MTSNVISSMSFKMGPSSGNHIILVEFDPHILETRCDLGYIQPDCGAQSGNNNGL